MSSEFELKGYESTFPTNLVEETVDRTQQAKVDDDLLENRIAVKQRRWKDRPRGNLIVNKYIPL